jgi:hypothetical protein
VNAIVVRDYHYGNTPRLAGSTEIHGFHTDGHGNNGVSHPRGSYRTQALHVRVEPLRRDGRNTYEFSRAHAPKTAKTAHGLDNEGNMHYGHANQYYDMMWVSSIV